MSAGPMAPVIGTARDLAWMPHSNLGGRTAHIYRDRIDAHERLVDALRQTPPFVMAAIPRDLMACIRRVASASFTNRRGLPYYERRAAMFELRGALDFHKGWLPR